MNFWKRKLLSGIIVAVLAVVVMTATVAHAQSWQIVSSPNVASSSSQLAAVAAVSANNVWAVGVATTQTASAVKHPLPSALRHWMRFAPTSSSLSSALIEQWNGTSWNIVPGATLPANNGSGLGAIAVIPRTHGNLWAVGYYQDSTTSFYDTLIEQWNGTSWSVIPSPNYNPATNYNMLQGVVALSPTNAWAVGLILNTQNYTAQTLIEHWNGTAWKIAKSIGPSTSNNVLVSVTALAANNVWGVGYYSDGNGFDESLTMHWNGSLWATIASPNVQTDINYNYLYGVAKIPGTSDLWAVGNNSPEACPCNNQTLIEQWNGSNWSIVSSPNSTSQYNSDLYSVAALSATNAWAVGETSDSNYQNEQTLIEQWDGTQWSIVGSPNVASESNYLYSVAAVPNSQNLWSVGYSVDSNSVDYTLAEYYG
jgi:hypothetical protein